MNGSPGDVDEQILQHQPWSPPDSEDEIEEEPRTLVRSRAFYVGGKRPRLFHDEPDETPDLGSYFEGWNMADKQQIVMCRAYASYLSAKKDAKKK